MSFGDNARQGAIVPFDAGGDGGGDGDCTPVERTFVTSVQEDSGAFCEVVGPFPLTIPSAAPLVLPLTLIASGGGASLITSPSSAVEFTADALHKAACNLGVIKLGGGANVCRITCEAQYGPPFAPWAPVPGGVFDVSLGGFASDELPPISFEAPLFSPSFAGQPGPVRFRWTAQEVGGGGGPLALYRGFVYGFQIQPVVTTETVNNCEGPAVAPCPQVTEVRIYDNTDPLRPVLIATKGPGAPPTFLGPNSNLPILAEIDLDIPVNPADWSLSFADGDAPAPPVSVGYASQTWSIQYTHPLPSTVSTVVGRFDQNPDAGTCTFSEALTTSPAA